MSLSAEQVNTFRDSGFLFPVAVNDALAADRVRAQWDEFEATSRLANSHRDLMYNRHLDQQFIWDIASSQRVLDALEQLLGPDILLFGTRIICKWSGDDTVVAWHQDVSERNQLDPPEQITAWYAIDDADESNGCVFCVSGSHKAGMRKRLPAKVPGNLLRVNEESEVSDEMARTAVPVRLKAGQLSFHHGFTLHSSPRNVSNRRRCGLVIRYVPGYVRQGSGVEFNQRDTAIVLRGRDPMTGEDSAHAVDRMAARWREYP